MTDTLAPWERWPVAALLAAAGLNTAVWYVGGQLTGALPFATQVMLTVGGVAAVVAIDGAMIATVAGMREGRRSRWGFGNIAVTALFTALAALSAHGVWPDIGGALHALFALTIVTYLMHLSQPKAPAVNSHVDSLSTELAETRTRLTQALAALDAQATEVSTPVKQLTAGVDERAEIVRWKDVDKLTFDAIGERLSISKQAAQARYRRAKGGA